MAGRTKEAILRDVNALAANLPERYRIPADVINPPEPINLNTRERALRNVYNAKLDNIVGRK